MRSLIPVLLVLLLVLVIVWQRQDSHATHDGSGEHIDQISIDVGPPGVAQGVDANGRPAAGDRDGDVVPDAEGYDTPDPGDTPGVCGNGLDDDLADSDGDTTPDLADGVADDGCVVPLSPRETCIEIIDDGILNADEDALVAGQDRAFVDVTVGTQPGPGGGVPASRGISAWQYSLSWSTDVLDVDAHNLNFLILEGGGTQPFSNVTMPLPVMTPPFVAAVSDAGPGESGAGVFSRITIEGNAAGLATLYVAPVATTVQDQVNVPVPIDKFNGAGVAVSKDVNGDTDLLDSGEHFTCNSNTDLEVTSVTVDAPSATSGLGFDVQVNASVRNNGPAYAGQLYATVFLTELSPCFLATSHYVTFPGLELEVSETASLPAASFGVRCWERTTAKMTAVVVVAPVSVLDLTFDNNILIANATTSVDGATPSPQPSPTTTAPPGATVTPVPTPMPQPEGEHIDQVSIDVGPPGVAQGVDANGKPATGDRDGDAVPDAEGYSTPDPGDAPGVCGNGLDDDLADSDGDTTPDLADGVADDGCVVPLSPRETCIEIIDDGILNADEDSLVAGQDRAVIDITVGAQPGPGGGVPASRAMTAWQFDLNWNLDVIDVDVINSNFLVLANGGGSPFSPIHTVPDMLSPMTASVSDAGHPDDGPGVLARLTIEGNAPGISSLYIDSRSVAFQDFLNVPIPVDQFNAAGVAVSKDLNGDTDLLEPRRAVHLLGSGRS